MDRGHKPSKSCTRLAAGTRSFNVNSSIPGETYILPRGRQKAHEACLCLHKFLAKFSYRASCDDLQSAKAQLQAQVKAMVGAEKELTENLKHTHQQVRTIAVTLWAATSAQSS